MNEQQVRELVVKTAREWLGFSEASGKHKQIIDMYNTIKPLPRGYKVTYSDPWCAAYVSAVAQKLGYTDVMLPECSCSRMVTLYQQSTVSKWEENDAYTPKIGDLLMYDWQDDNKGDNKGAPDHVGIVSAVNGNKLTIIEGNYSKSVKERVINVNGVHIRGYCLPNYAKKAQSGTSAPTPTPSAPASTPTPSTSNDKAIWDYLKGKGLNDFAVAGLMGNLFAESGLIPTNLQNTYNTKFGMTDVQYTKAVDDGTYSNFVKDSAGYGLAQWTYWSRKEALLNHAKSVKKSIDDLSMQLDFLWKELQGYKSVMDVLKNAVSVRQASDIVLLQYERPADQSAAVQAKRAAYGQGYYDKFAKQTSVLKSIDEIAKEVIAGEWGNSPQRAQRLTAAGYDATAVQKRVNEMLKQKEHNVKVTASALNIRKGPGVTFPIVGVIKDMGKYTIVETKETWGKLKDGRGWISLNYTKRA